MGLLSSLLTIGGTAVGTAFGMPQVGAAVGGALGGAVEGSRASKKASKAQVAAEQRAQARYDQAAGRINDLQAPYLSAGPEGMNALRSRLGVGTGAGTSSGYTASPGMPMASVGTGGTSRVEPGGEPVRDTFVDPRTGLAPGQGGEPTNFLRSTPATDSRVNWDAYLADNPDVAQAAAASGGDPRAYAEQHYGEFGRGENRALPMHPTQQFGYKPSAGAPEGPGQGSPGTFGDATNPAWTSPSWTPPSPKGFEYGLDDYKASPGYQWQIDEATKAVLASAGATGARQSGAALKELQDRAQGIAALDFRGERDFAHGRYRDERDFGYGRYRDDRDFGYGKYVDDRNYLTNRFDRGTEDLFRYTGIGRDAAGVVGGSEMDRAQLGAGSDRNVGQARAANALTQGKVWGDFAGGVGGIVSNYLNRPRATPGNVNFRNTPASISRNITPFGG